VSEPEEPPGETPPADPFGLTPSQGTGEEPDDAAQADVLDPDAAIIDRGGYRGPVSLEPVIDTRRYRWMIYGLGITLVVASSIYLAVHGGGKGGSAGIPAGQRLLKFVAPLAASDLDNPAANAHPVCNPNRPSRRGLNVCNRKPIVLAFFVTGEKGCVRQVDTLQTVSARFPHVTFAAVAVNADRAATRKLVRSHHWTIPVAYDVTNVLGQLYGVEVCPIVEIAKANGVVDQRLIGKYWLSPANLTRAVAKLER
jgi:hypothetical protein